MRGVREVLVLGSLIFGAAAHADPACVQIFYDQNAAAPSGNYFAQQEVLALSNLLAHFPAIQQITQPVQSYQPQQLNKCGANFYVGTLFDNPIPAAFLADYVATTSNVIWLGYNIWKLSPDDLNKLWNAQYQAIAGLDVTHLDAQGMPGFYRTVTYKGETYTKILSYNAADPVHSAGAFDLSVMTSSGPAFNSNIYASITHSSLGLQAPYILHNANHWFVTDLPFTYLSEGDRYLVFADALFDMLGATPRRTGPQPALFRIEDVHAKIPLWELYGLVDMCYRLQVPFTLATIPIFRDPLGNYGGEAPIDSLTIQEAADFKTFLTYAIWHGGSIIMHGVTHQYGNQPNPYSAVSAEDFEFWDTALNGPIPEDSPGYIVTHLEQGLTSFAGGDVSPVGWETPHYLASGLDNIIFGQFFLWNVGRVAYLPVTWTQAAQLPEELTGDRAGADGNGKRIQYFQDLAATVAAPTTWTSQFFPYELYGDAYGQRLIPENLGNFIAPTATDPGVGTDALLALASKESKIRDAWAAGFVHGQMLNDAAHGGIGKTQGDTSEIERYIAGIRALGFEFVDLKSWTRHNLIAKRPPTVDAN